MLAGDRKPYAARDRLRRNGVANPTRPTLSDPCVMLNPVIVTFAAELWLWDARRSDTWTFVSLPAEASEDIRDTEGGRRRGFGSVRVRVTIGRSTWTTSIFLSSADSTYVLPIKQAIRRAEGLDVGDTAVVTVELLDP